MKDKMILQPDISLEDNLLASSGRFAIKYRDVGHPEWKLHFAKKNLIVNSARKVMAHVISGDENWFINQLRLGGTNDVTAFQMLNPDPPTITDTNVVYTDNLFTRDSTDQIVGNPAWSVSYPNTPNETSVLFSITVGRNEANLTGDQPTVYLCSGLFTDSGNFMFSSQSFPVIAKTTQRELLIEWEIRF